MKHILYAIGFIWLLPVNILAWSWLLYMKHKGTFEDIWWDWNTWSWNWDVSNDSEFYEKSMEGWWGFVIGNNIVYVDYFPKLALDKTYIRHEQAHVLQNYILGVLFYPTYIVFTCWIYLFQWAKHAYIDNPFERWARRAAGQKVYLSPEEWPDGPNDRWPWW